MARIQLSALIRWSDAGWDWQQFEYDRVGTRKEGHSEELGAI